MAEAFQTVNVALGSSADAVVYTCPASKIAVVIHCQVANVDGTNAADLNVDMNDGSTVAALVSALSVPAKTAIKALCFPIISCSKSAYQLVQRIFKQVLDPVLTEFVHLF